MGYYAIASSSDNEEFSKNTSSTGFNQLKYENASRHGF